MQGWRQYSCRSGFSLLCIVLAATFLPVSVAADQTGLHITGKLKSGTEIRLTRSDLEAFVSETIITDTPWQDGKAVFEGVPMAKLMENVGAEGTTAFVLALNDYGTEIPLSDFERFNPILAYKKDGAYMDVSDKGPYFIVYPYDDMPELHNELYYSRSVWQVQSIEIE